MKYEQGFYANYPEFGALPPYKLTHMDLLEIPLRQFDLWKKILNNIDVNITAFSKHGSVLDTNWGPVKVNAHGTMEQRGIDMNGPRITTAIATLVKHISRVVHEQYADVYPSEIGISEPFRMEDNTIHIPPHRYVRFRLQPKSAYVGLEDPEIHAYCSALLKLGKSFIPKAELPLIEPLEQMLVKRKTVSDEILDSAKKMGIDIAGRLTNEQAAILASNLSKDLFKEIILAKQSLLGISAGE